MVGEPHAFHAVRRSTLGLRSQEAQNHKHPGLGTGYSTWLPHSEIFGIPLEDDWVYELIEEDKCRALVYRDAICDKCESEIGEIVILV